MARSLYGIPVCGKIGTGKAKLIDCSAPEYKIRKIDDTDRELGRMIRTLKEYCVATREQMESIKNKIGEQESKILQSHIKIAHDIALQSELIQNISDGMCAEQAFSEVCDRYIHRFLGVDYELVRQIAADVRDVKTCVLNRLLGIEDVRVEDFCEDTVIFAKELTPSVVARIGRASTKGVVVEIGDPKSHGALIARAIGFPGVSQVKDVDKLIKEGETVTVNGMTGEVTVA